jgi:hypothetical protein
MRLTRWSTRHSTSHAVRPKKLIGAQKKEKTWIFLHTLTNLCGPHLPHFKEVGYILLIHKMALWVDIICGECHI